MNYSTSLPRNLYSWNEFYDEISKVGFADKPDVNWIEYETDSQGTQQKIINRFEVQYIKDQALAELKIKVQQMVDPFTQKELEILDYALKASPVFAHNTDLRSLWFKIEGMRIDAQINWHKKQISTLINYPRK